MIRAFLSVFLIALTAVTVGAVVAVFGLRLPDE